MKIHKIIFLLMMTLVVIFVACEDEDEGGDEINITQEDLDGATNFIGFATGNPENSDAVVAHNGNDTLSPDSTYREIFASVSDLSGDIEPGTIVTKKVFAATPAGEKDPDRLFVSFAMVKREAGFDSDHADWEYIAMPNNDGNDFTAQPNGDLSGAEGRGKIPNCIDCHQYGGGGDYLFVND